jgi:hypothetical protein
MANNGEPHKSDQLSIGARRELRSRNANRLRTGIAFLVYFAVSLWLAWYIYDFTTDGVAACIGEAIGTLLIPGLIAFAFARRRSSVVPYYIAVAVSAAAYLSANSERIAEAYDARKYRAEMAHATPASFREIISHSQSHIGQTLNSVFEIAERHSKAMLSILSSLDDDRFQNMFTPDTLNDRSKRTLLKNLAKRKQEEAILTQQEMTNEFRSIRDEIVSTTHNLPAGMERSILTGFDETSPKSEKLVHDYIQTYVNSYRHLIALYDILDHNEGKFTVGKDGFVTFVENEPVAQYNHELADLRSDIGNLVKIRGEMVENQKAGIAHIIDATR